MSRSPTESELMNDTASIIAAMSRATSRASLLGVLQTYLQDVTQARELQLMWVADGVTQSLFQDQPTQRMPTPAEWVVLAGGDIVVSSSITYVPMLALGELRGWIALRSVQHELPPRDVVTVVGMALALTERQAYQMTPSRELAMMDTIGHLLSSTLQLDQLLPNLAEIVRELVIAHFFYIALLDEQSNTLSFAYYSPKRAEAMSAGPWSVDDGLTGLIIRSGSPIVTDDYVSECARYQIPPHFPAGIAGSRAWIGVPLRHQDRVLGVMVAASADPDVIYTEADVHLLSSVASQAAAALANAQLYKRVQQQANQLATINRIGRTISATLDPQEVPMLIMQELQAAVDVEDGSVLIEDPATGELVVRYTLEPKMGLRIPHGAGVAGDALRQQSVQIANDIQADSRQYPPLDSDGPIATRSIICVPVTGRHELRGVIQLRNKRSGPFTETDAQLLSAVAEQAAVALQNAELYAHTDNALEAHVANLEQRNQQLTSIVAISNTLRAANTMNEVCRQIVATVQTMTASPRVALALVEPERRQMRAVAQIGLDPADFAPRQEYWVPLDAAEEVLRQAHPIRAVIHHVGQSELVPAFQDCVALTLLDTHGLLVGAIGFDLADGTKPLSNALLQELEIVANQAAIAVVNAQLASEQEQTVDRLTALNALSLAVTTTQLSTDEIMQMTVRGAIGTTSAIGGGAYVLARDDSFRRLVIELPQGCDTPILPYMQDAVEDYVELDNFDVPRQLREAGVYSVVIVPVRGAKLTLGCLWIGYGDAGIAPTDREMVVLYAKTAGAVLENLRLFDQVSAAHDRLVSILASTVEGILMATAAGNIAAVNDSFTHLMGLTGGSLEGRPIANLVEYLTVAADRAQLTAMCEALSRVASGESSACDGELSLHGAVTRYVAWSVLPVRGGNQQHSGALLVLRDVTAERQSEKLRQDLANMIVHDLRAPLTNMMVSLDLLLKQITGPLTSAQQRIINIAGESSQQMLDLVNALLDIRRLEQRQLDLQRQPVELFEIVEGVFERSERLAADRHVVLNNATATTPTVSVDLDLVRRILQNLVDNAIKFSPRNGRVTVKGYAATAADLPAHHGDGSWIVVDIVDEGVGVPEQYRSVIFELFGQAPHGRGHGTGLGLAFCKLAVAAHGGLIWVEDAPGGGAIFRFTLPAI